MDITYRIAGLARLQKAVQLTPGVLAARNAIALQASVDLVRRVTIAGTAVGPGHFGFHLVDRFSTRVVGGLRRQIGIVSTDAPQGRWRETGTKAHDIAPRKAQAMTIFPQHAAGLGIESYRFASRVHHPGEKARHTMRNALRDSKPTIRAYFVGATQEMVKTMAGSGD